MEEGVNTNKAGFNKINFSLYKQYKLLKSKTKKVADCL